METFEQPNNFEGLINEETEEENPVRTEQELETEEIDKEKEAAGENFSSLIELVKQRYQSPDSTLSNSEQLEAFEKHNQEVLDLCIERGIQKGLGKKELKMLEVAAVLHDLNKGDKPASEVVDIPNYILAAHGDMAAKEIKEIVNTHPEVLDKILEEGYTEEEKEEVIDRIKKAIKSHMGPHPGFMDEILTKVNQALQEKGMAEIEHPYPEEGDEIAKTLLAANMHLQVDEIAKTLLAVDMRALAGEEGRKKVLAIRSAVPFFKEQDEQLCLEYKEYGIHLSVGEAALLSGFDSAEQAQNMLKDPEDNKWVGQAIEASKEKNYIYAGKPITYQDAISKREQFEFEKAQIRE
ncbi:HD domain-containing protein [Patescibacteria group bacterium]|nr:HD domain-containing protein [Patescibacteria group bacterium]MBU1246901.1 HD domain-containing protein [Patescibacteria group bacterium]MBU1519737.1 HD domain-containing protein [Patescibacteria group bacterium]MBU1730084.1 HD domain-containing protein [Patescibacteria group bacterium]MBU1956729.1 HD domain-containing protein [Patescibacteria group bacterium]